MRGKYRPLIVSIGLGRARRTGRATTATRSMAIRTGIRPGGQQRAHSELTTPRHLAMRGRRCENGLLSPATAVGTIRRGLTYRVAGFKRCLAPQTAIIICRHMNSRLIGTHKGGRTAFERCVLLLLRACVYALRADQLHRGGCF